MKKLEQFKKELFEKEISKESMKKVNGGLMNYTRTGCVKSNSGTDYTCSDTDADGSGC